MIKSDKARRKQRRGRFAPGSAGAKGMSTLFDEALKSGNSKELEDAYEHEGWDAYEAQGDLEAERHRRKFATGTGDAVPGDRYDARNPGVKPYGKHGWTDTDLEREESERRTADAQKKQPDRVGGEASVTLREAGLKPRRKGEATPPSNRSRF
jgi:hypothetical protein